MSDLNREFVTAGRNDAVNFWEKEAYPCCRGETLMNRKPARLKVFREPGASDGFENSFHGWFHFRYKVIRYR